jgi:hypothetical protein
MSDTMVMWYGGIGIIAAILAMFMQGDRHNGTYVIEEEGVGFTAMFAFVAWPLIVFGIILLCIVALRECFRHQ